MSEEAREILDRARKLPAAEVARLVDELLASLDRPDPGIDELWGEEVESRLAALKAGRLRTVSLEEVLAKYRK